MDTKKRLTIIRIWTGYIYFTIMILLAEPEIIHLVVGSIFCAFGLVIRILAAGSSVKAEELVTGGIYQMTRNPRYLGSFFIGFGLNVMSGHLWLIAIYFIIFIPLYNIMIKTEEEFLLNAFGIDFEEYSNRVPRLFPAPGAPPGLLVNFSIRKYHLNREFLSNLAVLLVAAILWLFWHFNVESIILSRM